MTKDLLDSVYGQLKSAVSATTSSNVFYTILPNEDILQEFSVVYSVTNITNEITFDTPEAVKTYSVTVQINNPTTSQIISNVVFIKDRIFKLPSVNSLIKYVSIADEDLFHDFDLKIFTGYLKFNVQYSD